MKPILAAGHDYLNPVGFPLAIGHVRTDADYAPSRLPDLTEVKHYHNFCELAIVTHGQAMHWVKGGEFPVTAGDVFLLQGRQSHYFFRRQDLRLTNVMYDQRRIGLPEEELRRMPGYCAMFLLESAYRRQHRFASRLHLGRAPLAHVEQLVEELDVECAERRVGYEAAVCAKLIELIVFLARSYDALEVPEAQALLRVGHVIRALENDFSRNWKIDELLQIAHMSRSNLICVFRKATGHPPIEYLLRIRIQKAMQLLRGTSMNITEIAMETGFNDSNYFSRQFKCITGESPSSYRKTAIT